jgi:hypothetical protein
MKLFALCISHVAHALSLKFSSAVLLTRQPARLETGPPDTAAAAQRSSADAAQARAKRAGELRLGLLRPSCAGIRSYQVTVPTPLECTIEALQSLPAWHNASWISRRRQFLFFKESHRVIRRVSADPDHVHPRVDTSRHRVVKTIIFI